MSASLTAHPSVPAAFFARAADRAEALALRHKERGLWRRVSWAEYALEVRRAAAALIQAGVQPGDRVAILGDNRPEWLYGHLGAMAVGAASCGIYPTCSSEQIGYVLSHSGARVLFLEDEEQVEKTLPILERTAVQRVVVWDRKGLWGFDEERLVFYDEFRQEGSERLGSAGAEVDARIASVKPGDTAMIVYTSGTTGHPKGAMLTHANVLFLADTLAAANPPRPDDEGLSYLPLSHIFENLMSLFLPLAGGGAVSFAEGIESLFGNLREVSPTVLAGVPRVWEKIASIVELRMQDSTWLKRRAYMMALGVGRRFARTRLEEARGGAAAPLGLSLARGLARLLVLRPLCRQLGLERVRLAICGAAPASPELFEYFHAIGVPLIEGYGMTESCGVISANRLERPRVGTVGEPLEGIEVRIAEDGEILTRGPHVFAGYFRDPEQTAQAVDTEGWLHTGDVGELVDGHLRILDRKRDILITAGGKNIAPAVVENALKWSPYIQDAVVLGDRRNYVAALILIDEDNVAKYAQDHRVPFSTFEELTRRPEVRRLVQQEVDAANARLSRVESVRRFALLPRRFYTEDGDVTPTQKVKRRSVESRYADLVEELYR